MKKVKGKRSMRPARAPSLSKSKILSGLQCPKRLWLEVHRPDLAEISSEMQKGFEVGDAVTKAARALRHDGVLVEAGDTAGNLRETSRLLKERPGATLFEATFRHQNVVVRTDVLSPFRGRHHLTEVKAAASTDDRPYPQDCAIQAWVLDGAGISLGKVELAYINNQFVYAGDGNYAGLFTARDMRKEIRPLLKEVPRWVRKFKQVLAGDEPDIEVDDHCWEPYTCPFIGYCLGSQPEFPVVDLPGRSPIIWQLRSEGIEDIRQIPPGRLRDEKREWIRRVTKAGRPDLRTDAVAHLKRLGYPRYHLDFETIQFAVPVWPATRPYEQLLFQWSCHIEDGNGNLAHKEFLDTSGQAPMRAAVESMIAALGRRGPVLVYHGFEETILKKLAARFPDLASAIHGIVSRLHDLLPNVRQAYYHADMRGSWSMKAVLPTIAPHLDYSRLGEVQDAGAAGPAYLEMIHPATSEARRNELAAALRAYCGQDTLGLVEVLRYLTSGRRPRSRRTK